MSYLYENIPIVVNYIGGSYLSNRVILIVKAKHEKEFIS